MIPIIDYSWLGEIARTRRQEYSSGHPFPHIVIDNFLQPEVADKVLLEFLQTMDAHGIRTKQWVQYKHYNENKSGLEDLSAMGPQTRLAIEALQSPEFILFLENLTGASGLLADPLLDGGGLHVTQRGGFLNVHTDFRSHTARPTWSREINLLLYLNKGWNSKWGGYLELWDPAMTHCGKSISPIFNRCVLFSTNGKSCHGHPTKLNCPSNESRKSIALYYFQEKDVKLSLKPTKYRPRPEDATSKQVMIAVDTGMVRLYSFLRRRLGVQNRSISQVLKYFKK